MTDRDPPELPEFPRPEEGEPSRGAKGDDQDGVPERDPEQGSANKPPIGLGTRGTIVSTAKYSRFVGIAFVVVAIIAGINAITADPGEVLGTAETGEGGPLPEFAVPLAVGELEGDANIAQDDCEIGRNPCPEDRVRKPACEIDPSPDLIRVCDLFDKPLLISFWFTRGADCLPAQRSIERLADKFDGRVNFLSINVRDDRERVREIVREESFDIPVGYDADGALSNIYLVSGCPAVALAYPGGILHKGLLGDAVTPANLEREIRGLIEESRARAAGNR